MLPMPFCFFYPNDYCLCVFCLFGLKSLFLCERARALTEIQTTMHRIKCQDLTNKSFVEWKTKTEKKWQHQNVTCLTVKLFLRWKLIPESWYNVHKIPNDLIQKFVQPVNTEINAVAVLCYFLCMWFFLKFSLSFRLCFHSCACMSWWCFPQQYFSNHKQLAGF